jgi:hypothetical protein
MPAPENTQCPACGYVGLNLVTRWGVLGPAHVAGVMTKVSARPYRAWECPACAAHGPAEYNERPAEPDPEHAKGRDA